VLGNAYIAFTLHKSREQINFRSLLNPLPEQILKNHNGAVIQKLDSQRALINLMRRARKTPLCPPLSRRIELPNGWNKASKA